MVKKINRSAVPAANVEAATAETNGKKSTSQLIRDYAIANPTARPADIAKALSTDDAKINSARVSGVLRSAKPKIDVETIKAAGAFVKSCKGGIAGATSAIELVGSFVETCGSAANALAALESFKELSEAMSG